MGAGLSRNGVALLLVGALFAAACNAIVGIQDVPEGTSDSGGSDSVGSSSSSGSSGGSPSGGSSGGGPSSGSGGGSPSGSNSASSRGSGGGASGSSSGSSAGTSSGGSSSSGSGVTYGPVIDDMTSVPTGTGGYWYTYSDRTVPESEPAILKTPLPPGAVTPPDGVFPFPFATGTGPTVPGVGMVNARECSGGGEALWGAGFGMDLVDVWPDGGPSRINTCEAGSVYDVHGSVTSGVVLPLPFDAHAYPGFSFWGQSATENSQILVVHVGDRRTNPWGGICDPCGNGGIGACSDDFLKSYTFTSTWQQFVVHWTDLHPLNWSEANLQALDLTSLYIIHFQPLWTTAPLPKFDIRVAYLRWITN